MNTKIDAKELSSILGVSERSVQRLAKKQKWVYSKKPVRGGFQHSYVLNNLPENIQAKVILHLHKTGQLQIPEMPVKEAKPTADIEWTEERSVELWNWAQSSKQTQRDKGAEKASFLYQVYQLIHSPAGPTIREALRTVADSNEGVTEGSLRRWWYDGTKLGKPIDHFPLSDWPALLMPRHGSIVKEIKELHENAWDWYCAYYLNRRRPSFAEAYRRVTEAAEANGWGDLPSEATMKRRLMREFSKQVIVLRREGPEAMMRLYPTQRRDKTMFSAGEAINGDGLKFDSLWVAFPDGEILNTVTGWLWQDIRTNKILAYRLAKTENTDVFRLSTYDLLEICSPSFAWIDNTRVAANKAMTGRAHGRHRFKNREDDPLGLLQQVGIEPHFTDPSKEYGNPGAKPIERAFGVGGIHGKVSSHPLFLKRGYSQKTAISFDEFAKVVAEEVARFNAQKGRRNAECNGVLSYDEAFERLFTNSVVRKIPESQRALMLLMPEVVTVDRNRFFFSIKAGKGPWGSHRYGCEDLACVMGEKVVVYYDPADLSKDVSVHRLDGTFVAVAQHLNDVGFNDTETAREWRKNKARLGKNTKKAAKDKLRMDELELAALYPEVEAAEIPEPGIISLDFGRKRLEQEPLPKVANGYEEGGPRPDEQFMLAHFVNNRPQREDEDFE